MVHYIGNKYIQFIFQVLTENVTSVTLELPINRPGLAHIYCKVLYVITDCTSYCFLLFVFILLFCQPLVLCLSVTLSFKLMYRHMPSMHSVLQKLLNKNSVDAHKMRKILLETHLRDLWTYCKL